MYHRCPDDDGSSQWLLAPRRLKLAKVKRLFTFHLSECLRIRSELTPRLGAEGCSVGLTAFTREGSSEGARTSPQMPTQL